MPKFQTNCLPFQKDVGRLKRHKCALKDIKTSLQLKLENFLFYRLQKCRKVTKIMNNFITLLLRSCSYHFHVGDFLIIFSTSLSMLFYFYITKALKNCFCNIIIFIVRIKFFILISTKGTIEPSVLDISLL